MHAPPDRIHYFDWLRAASVLGVIVYHALLPFRAGGWGWMVTNAEGSELLNAVLLVVETFGIGLLFLLAGASVRFALRTRSRSAFLAERAARLLVPFVVGTILFSPVIWYISAISGGRTAEPFLAYLAGWPAEIAGWAIDVGFSPKLLQVGVHLWFLAWLFAFSALGLPAIGFLESRRGRWLVDWLGRGVRRRGATLLFAVPVTLPILLLFAGSKLDSDWWTFGWYGAIFLAGYVLYADERLVAAVRRDLGPAVVVGTVALAGLLVLDFPGWAARREVGPFAYDPTYVLMVGLYGLTGWAWTLALLNLGIRARFMQHPLPLTLSQAVLPGYVLHLPIVLAISYVVVQWPLGLLLKVLIVVGLGVGITVIVAVAALRLPALRLVLGVRGRRGRAAEPAFAT